MPEFVFDTSHVIEEKVTALPRSCIWSEVVLFELISRAGDHSRFKALTLLREIAVKDNELLTIESEDWGLASATIYRLEKGKNNIQAGQLRSLLG